MSGIATGSVIKEQQANNRTMMRQIVRGALTGYGLQFLSVPFTIAGSIYLLRALSVAEYGVLALLLAVNLYLCVLSHLGIPMAIVRYVPEYRSQGRHKAVRMLLMWAFLIRYAVLTAMLGATYWAIDPIAGLLNAPSLADHFGLFALFIVVDIGVQMCSAVLESLLLQPYLNLGQVGFAAIKLPLLVVFLEAGRGLDGAIAALIVADVLLLALYAGRMVHELIHQHGGEGPQGDLARLVRYCRSWYLAKLSSLGFDVSTGLYLVSFFLGPAAVGLYAFAYNTASQAMRFFSPSAYLWSALTPASVSGARHDNQLLTALCGLTTKAVLVFALPVIAGAFLLGEKGISYVFGVQYASAALVFAFTTVAVYMAELEQPVRMLMAVKEKIGALLVNRVLILYNLAAACILIPRFGIEGVVMATGTTTFFAVAITYVAARRYHPLSLPWRECARIAANASIVGLLLFLLRPWVTDLASLLAVALLAAALYVGLTLRRVPFTKGEIALVRGGVSTGKDQPPPFMATVAS